MDGVHSHFLVRELFWRTLTSFDDHTSDYADFNIPPSFQARVRNALNAEARSVKLSNLVGHGGLWYGFGRMLMKLYVASLAAQRSY